MPVLVKALLSKLMQRGKPGMLRKIEVLQIVGTKVMVVGTKAMVVGIKVIAVDEMVLVVLEIVQFSY